MNATDFMLVCYFQRLPSHLTTILLVTFADNKRKYKQNRDINFKALQLGKWHSLQTPIKTNNEIFNRQTNEQTTKEIRLPINLAASRANPILLHSNTQKEIGVSLMIKDSARKQHTK